MTLVLRALLAVVTVAWGGWEIYKATNKSGAAVEQVVPPNATPAAVAQAQNTQGPEIKQRVQAARKVPRGPENPVAANPQVRRQEQTPPPPQPKTRPSEMPGPRGEDLKALGRLFDRYGVNTPLVQELYGAHTGLFGTPRGMADSEALLRDPAIVELRRKAEAATTTAETYRRTSWLWGWRHAWQKWYDWGQASAWNDYQEAFYTRMMVLRDQLDELSRHCPNNDCGLARR